jgi:glycosyltransferase involved in cell wall biosynthesis
MKILNISLDKKLFEAGSGVEERVLEYAEIFDRFDILVLSCRHCSRRIYSSSVAKRSREVLDKSRLRARFDKLEQYPSGENICCEKREFEKIAIWPTNSRNKLFYLVDALRLGREMIEKYGYDLISVQEPFETGFIGWRLARKYGLKFQVQLHGDFFGSPYFRNESLLNQFRYYLGRFIIGRADGIRVVSERIKKSLLAMGIKEEKISVAPIYAEIKSLSIRHAELVSASYEIPKQVRDDGEEIPKQVRDDEKEIPKQVRDDTFGVQYDDERGKKFIFLTVGRLVPVKNIQMQIEAMAAVVKNYPEAELWVVGDGREREKLKTSSFKFQVSNNVKFCGWSNNPAEFYQQADVFLLTSNYEGWGLAAVEAASFGLPIIMTDVGCAGEFIIDGKSGLVVPVGDSEKLAENMLKLISDENLRKRLGEGTRQAVLNLPNKKKSLEMYKEACEKI